MKQITKKEFKAMHGAGELKLICGMAEKTKEEVLTAIMAVRNNIGETMTYQDAKKNVFARGSIPDGYFGERCLCEFAFDHESGKTLTVCSCGFFTSPIPPAINKEEALWFLQHHPVASHININQVY